MSRPAVVHAVRSDAFAGVERYICEVVPALTRRGWRTAVVGGDAAQMRKHLPPDVRHVPATTTRGVARALLSLEPDLVHSHMTAADVASCVVKPLTRAALVSTRHFPAPRGSRPSTQRVLRPLLSGLDVRIAISGYVASAHLDDREHVLLHGIADRELVPHGARHHEVLMLQRLEPEKNGETALRAWAISRLRSHGWVLRIAGDGSQRARLQALARELCVDQSVEFLGFVHDPAPLLRRAGALLAPTPIEAFGLAVVEAMASGTPVVAARGGGHIETLGAGAWLFDPEDHEACAGLLDQLADEPAAAGAYGCSLQKAQRTHLSLDAHVATLETLYLRALDGRTTT